jgi:hypothetical protein
LDQDEEEFLVDLRHASDLLCFDPFSQIRSAESQGDHLQEIRSTAPEDTHLSPVSVRHPVDALYDRYRRWSNERCPIEIIQVRSGGRTICTLDLARDGSSWRLRVKTGDAPLQFWTIRRGHQDEVMLAAYPIPRRASGRTEASTLSFASGQSLSALASARGNADFDVLLHCTAPQVPGGARYVVYNFDSFASQGSLEEAGLRYCKTSWLLNDFDKLSELRCPAPDLEAARIFREHPREKNIAELINVAAEQYWQDAEPLRLCHPPEVGGTSFDAQEDKSDQSATVVALLKDWVGCHSDEHLYHPYRRMSEAIRQDRHVGMCCTGGEVWRDSLRSFLPYTSYDRLHLIVGARIVFVTDSYFRFFLTNRGAEHEQDVSCCAITKDTSYPVVWRRFSEYYRHCTSYQSWPRLSVPFGTGGRERFLSQLTWPALVGDSIDANQWHLMQADSLAQLERVLAKFMNEWGTNPCGSKVGLKYLLERLYTTAERRRRFEGYALRVLDHIGRAEPFEPTFGVMGDASSDPQLWPLGSDIGVVIPVAASLLTADACGNESNDELP